MSSMSMRLSMIRLPVSSDSARANFSRRSRSSAATFSRNAPRSGAGTEDQAPESKAARAAEMARSASSRPASDTVATSSPSAGLWIWRTAPDAAGSPEPLMKRVDAESENVAWVILCRLVHLEHPFKSQYEQMFKIAGGWCGAASVKDTPHTVRLLLVQPLLKAGVINGRFAAGKQLAILEHGVEVARARVSDNLAGVAMEAEALAD